MPNFVDLTGKIYARLTVVSRAENAGKEARWNCICECGGSATVYGISLKSGDTKSCGCLAREVTSKRTKTHGMFGTPEWNAWASMKARCSQPSHANYSGYGARGIGVCKEWAESFDAFYKSMGPKPSPDHQLDRIDNDGNYEPENCRWATRLVNMQNRRVTKRYAGLTLRQWADKTGISYDTLKTRARRGTFNP